MSAQQPSQAGVTLDQLKEILTLNNTQQMENMKMLVTELRKPADPTPEQLAQKEADKKMREDRAALELEIQAGRDRERRLCSHRHPNGQSCVTPIDNLGCVICVHCQAMIKPAKGPFDEEGRFIYDETMYWTLLGARQQTTF